MTDRRASLRHRSPISEASPVHREGGSGAKHQPVSFFSRRRPLRGTAAVRETTQQPASSLWVDTDRGDTRKPKGRASSRKASETSSLASSGASRHRRDSATGADTHSRRRPRPTEHATLSRRPVRQKHASLQRRVESLGELPNPSLLSVLSGTTHLSGASSESTSTVTQQSHDRSSSMFKRKSTAGKRAQPKRAGDVSAVDRQQSDVLNYIKRGRNPRHFQQHAPSSTASSASLGQTEASVDGDSTGPSATNEWSSPLTSPASIVKPDSPGLHVDDDDEGDEEELYDDDDDEDGDGEFTTGISVREASPESVHQPSVSDAVDEDDERVDSKDESSEEEYHVGDAVAGAAEHARYAHHMALERMAPPRLPSSSSSSRHSDRHSRRLRRQEQALSDHVLQPRPHRDFHFVGAASPHANHTVPLYSPAPVQMGHPSPSHQMAVAYPPGYQGNHAMLPHPPPPMAPPSVLGPPPVPPYPPPYPAHPTHLARHHMATGYELLARKLSEGSREERRGGDEHDGEERVVPLYRKFAYLNHRVLLHIQDEIAEMEEELRDMDESLGQYSPRDSAGRMHPASRRGEARYGSEMHHRRTELLGRIYLKLGQYNSALSSYSNMIKDMAPAETDEVQAYRAWLEKRTPIEAGETQFLSSKDDLVAVAGRGTGSTAGGVASHQASGAVWLPMILVMPLMAFAMVPGLVGRVFVLCAMGAGTMKLVSTTQELRELLAEGEWAACFSAYFGVMVVLAAVVK